MAQGARHVTMPPLSSPLLTLNDNIEADDAPAQFHLTSPLPRTGASTTAFYMQWKWAEVSGSVVLLDPALLKPGCKASAMSKCRQPRGDMARCIWHARRPVKYVL